MSKDSPVFGFCCVCAVEDAQLRTGKYLREFPGVSRVHRFHGVRTVCRQVWKGGLVAPRMFTPEASAVSKGRVRAPGRWQCEVPVVERARRLHGSQNLAEPSSIGDGVHFCGHMLGRGGGRCVMSLTNGGPGHTRLVRRCPWSRLLIA